MAKITIIDGNDEIELSTAPKENIKAYMVKGEPGTDGVSPTITASRTGKVTTLTMTDKNGTTSADINDGVDPTVTTSKVDRTTTMTITDINGTRTTEIYDGIDLTGGVPTNGVIGFDTDEIIYTCDGTETGDYYLTYDGVDFSFTMPQVEDGDVLVFNTSTLTLTLDNTTITTQPLPGTGTELTFDYDIPGGYERTDEPFPGAETSGGGIIALKSITTAPATFSKDDKYYNSTDDLIYTATSSSAWNNGETPDAVTLYLNEADNKLYRYYNNTMNLEAGETLPVGSEIDYDGSTVPTGWEEIDPARKVASASIGANYTISANNTYEQLPMTTINTSSEKLSLTDGGIRIGSGISKVLVSTKVSFNSIATTGLKWVTIMKNSANSAVSANPDYLTQRFVVSATPTLINVTEGDILYLYVNGTAGDVVRQSIEYTNLTVDVVK